MGRSSPNFPLRLRADRRHSGRAFTLIELLVVVGIISVLLGLLLTTVARARQAANEITCMSNMHQWAVAALMYADQNGGYLPRRGQGVGPTFQVTRATDWFNALPPMIGLAPYAQLVANNQIARPDGKSIWLCPAAADRGGPYYWSYGMNMGLSVWDVAQNNGQPDKISGVGSPSVMVFLTDAPGNYCSVFPSMYPDGYNPVPRHNGRVNICFLDGHVAAIPGSYIGCGTGLIRQPDVVWHPPGNTWNGAQ